MPSATPTYSPIPIEPQTPQSLERTWGTETLLAETPQYTLKRLDYRAGKAGGLQYHTTKDESFHLFSGDAFVLHDRGDGNLWQDIMEAGQTFHIPAGAVHQFVARTDCVVFEASTPVRDDRVRMEHWYGLREPEAGGLPSTSPEPVRP